MEEGRTKAAAQLKVNNLTFNLKHSSWILGLETDALVGLHATLERVVPEVGKDNVRYMV